MYRVLRDKIGITRHIMMHQVVQLPNEEGIVSSLSSEEGYSTWCITYDMPCDPNLVSSKLHFSCMCIRIVYVGC